MSASTPPPPPATPTILIIDDDVAGSEISKKSALHTITTIASTLGYDQQQLDHIVNSVRFFAQYQYNEHDTPESKKDNPLPKEQCAQHYIRDRNGDTEVPVLAFIDNNFKITKNWSDQHGYEITQDLKEEADKRKETPPAMVWISSDPSPKITRDIIGEKEPIIRAEKLRLEKVKNMLERDPDKRIDKKALFDLAKNPYKAAKYDGSDKSFEEIRLRKDQVLIHTLRDAFEQIAGPPKKPEVWQQWISEKNADGVPGRK